MLKPIEVTDAAIAEYRLALLSDPRNTEVMRDRPGVIQNMQRDAMCDAIRAALGKQGG